MSVTFYPEIRAGDTKGFEIWCDAHGRKMADRSTYRGAKLFAESHESHCDPCFECGARVEEITDVPSVNVANVNAGWLLDQLGYGDGGVPSRDPMLCGDMGGDSSAEDFLGRVCLAMGMTGHDEGVPGSVLPSDGGARFVDCGRREGYGDERLEQLRKLAEWCVKNDRRVCWA